MGLANANSGVVGRLSGRQDTGAAAGWSPPEDLVSHVSPFGVIPKPHQPGKWRLIVNLSAPEGASVNDGVNSALAGLQYARLEDAARLALQLGNEALLAKLDLKAAYRMIPVHPADRPLLEVQWKGHVGLDAALTFGLRSAHKIFSAVADALLWVMRAKGVSCGLHYLDDFLFFGRGGLAESAENLRRALETCRSLGLPVALQKIGGPATTQEFLGIELDTVRGELRLSAEKLRRLREKLTEALQSLRWSRAWKKRELLSLIGLLHHAASIICPGRAFVRRLIELSRVPRKLHHRVRISQEARRDVEWWLAFATQWNGIGLMSALQSGRQRAQLQTDASGSWRFGAVLVSVTPWQGFAARWTQAWQSCSIAPKEMYPVLAACLLSGKAGSVLQCG
ncbi:uncharacterized protein [Oscarella lobularis]|uniref:uncharacterized protein n=1 Tax=Oscarella lobularis TaxID=121494 RepID=UPI003313BF75